MRIQHRAWDSNLEAVVRGLYLTLGKVKESIVNNELNARDGTRVHPLYL